MNNNEAQIVLNRAVSPKGTPDMKKNKSWLLVFKCKENKIHFYDVKFSIHGGFTRIMESQPTHELLDVTPFIDVSAAGEMATKIHETQKLIEFYEQQIKPAAAAPAAAGTTDSAEPAKTYQLR
jgi:hypothetical protein